MVDILQFYKETTEKAPEDQVLEKFGHAGAERSQYASPNPSTPASPTMYPTNYMGMQLLFYSHRSQAANNVAQEALRTLELHLQCLPRAMVCPHQKTWCQVGLRRGLPLVWAAVLALNRPTLHPRILASA